jgi:hypothetical protein
MSDAVTAILTRPAPTVTDPQPPSSSRADEGRWCFCLICWRGARTWEVSGCVIPGGFFGDHLGAGRIFATMLVARLRDQLTKFLDDRKPLLGVCNASGTAEAGILPNRTPGQRRWPRWKPVRLV